MKVSEGRIPALPRDADSHGGRRRKEAGEMAAAKERVLPVSYCLGERSSNQK
jgi:hypothetical protein